MASTWDGRVHFSITPPICALPFPNEPIGSGQNCNISGVGPGKKKIRWETWVFRPEAVPGGSQTGGPSAVDLGSTALYSTRELLDTDPYIDPVTLLEVASPSNTDGRNMISVYPDPNYPTNPYKSDAAGVEDLSGSYETYRIVIIGKVDCTIDAQNMTDLGGSVPYHCAQPPDKGILAQIPAHIVIRNPRTLNAVIHSTGIDVGSGGAKSVKANGSPIKAIEPSVSMDGRLIIHHGFHPTSGVGGFLYYTYNHASLSDSGWSNPRPLSDMYWFDRNTMVGPANGPQVKFSELFPISATPLKSPDGEIFTQHSPFPGAYPWISFDATEISFSVVPNFKAVKRSGFSMIGELTNWTVQHIDGPVNLARGNVVPHIGQISETQQRYLHGLYDQLHTTKGWRRLFVGQVGLSDTMWDLGRVVSDSALPVSKRDLTYHLFMSDSGDYVEIPLDTVADGNYIIRWTMNELLSYDRTAIQNELYGGSSYFLNKRLAVQYDEKGTPDISGSHWNGELSALAMFPFEAFDAGAIWDTNTNDFVPGEPLEDYTVGVNGNSIVAFGGAQVSTIPRTSLSAADQATITAQLQRVVDQQEFTAELWIRPLAGTTVEIIGIPTLVRVDWNPDGSLTTDVDGAVNTTLSTMPALVSTNIWTHVAVVSGNGLVSIYVNGNVVAQTELRAPLQPDVSGLTVGIGAVGAVGFDHVQLDEFAFSNVARSTEEIRVSAYLHDTIEVVSEFDAITVPPEYDALDQFVSDERDINGAIIVDVVNLGRELFESTILSGNSSVSCASCHVESDFFSDEGNAFSTGVSGTTSRNTPSIANRLFGSQHMLDGRASSLEEQILLPLENPNEMDFSIEQAVSALAADPDFSLDFTNIFGRAVNEEDLKFALASYVRSIVVDPNVPGPGATGKDVFDGRGRCIACHNGPNFTDERFHNVGVLSGDPGLAATTGRETDTGKFKTPSLLGVAETAPYFHNGQFATLTDVIEFYDRGGDSTNNRDFRIKPLGLTQAEKDDLATYLQSLGGILLNP